MPFKLKKSIKMSFIIFCLILGLLLHFYFPRFLTEIRNPVVQFAKSELDEVSRPSFDTNLNHVDCFDFKTFDEADIRACMTMTKQDSTQGTIVLLHGIRSNKEHFIELSKWLSNRGYNSIALDLRAHGESGGLHCTFGVHEKIDIQYLLDYLESKDIDTNRVGIWGQSLGAAISLQAMAHDDRLKFGIIESTFTDFETIANDYADYHAGFNFEPLTNYMVYRAGKIADFDPYAARPCNACKQIKNPVLVVHGDKDLRINIKYGKENFNNLNCSHKEFLKVEGANHVNVWEKGGEAYWEHVLGFIESALD